jgi:hypothetical protein
MWIRESNKLTGCGCELKHGSARLDSEDLADCQVDTLLSQLETRFDEMSEQVL